MVKAETTYISLSCWGNSIEIIKKIASHFGGWMDENDCDDEEYYEVSPTGEKIEVKMVTMQEIYEKFGEIVIIKEM